MHKTIGQLQPVSHFCTRLINPTVHMTFLLYSVSVYCFYAFCCIYIANMANVHACPETYIKSEHRYMYTIVPS